ncbi:MAG: HD domain-containing protein [Anaerolineae bacterium]
MIDRIQQIESYVKQAMEMVTAPDLRIAHDFKHVEGVRGWALRIARGEGIRDLELVEAAVLLHDIGLTCVEVAQRHQHGPVGADIAAQFLREHRLFDEDEIQIIADAIRYHSSPRGGGPLGVLLRDADKLDALGAAGLMRAFTSKCAKPEYAPHNIKGDTWELPMAGFEALLPPGKGSVSPSSTR